MNCFYRLRTDIRAVSHQRVFYRDDDLNTMDRLRKRASAKKIIASSSKKIDQDRTPDNVDCFETPFLGAEHFQQKAIYEVHPGGEFEDIMIDGRFPFLSEKMKRIIGEYDDIEHEFIPITLYDVSGNKLGRQQYYLFNCRRSFEIPAGDFKAKFALDSPLPHEEYGIGSIQNSEVLYQYFLTVPIWVLSEHKAIYINADLYQTLEQAGVAGIETIVNGLNKKPEDILYRPSATSVLPQFNAE